jgi:hypothetical protein
LAKQIKKEPKKKASKKSKYPLFKIQDLKVIAVLIFVFIMIVFYNIFLKSNVIIKTEKCYIFIPSGYSSGQLADLLKEKNNLYKISFYLFKSGKVK